MADMMGLAVDTYVGGQHKRSSVAPPSARRTAGGSPTAGSYRRFGTVKAGGKSKFPIFDTRSASAAEHLKGRAKPPLTASQSSAIDRRAARFGAGPLARDTDRDGK